MIHPYLGQAEIGMFLNAKRFEADNVAMAADKGISFLRLGADAGDGASTYEKAAVIKQHGIKVRYSLMKAYLLTPEQARAYEEGWIHIHDFDFYALTTTCCQIDLLDLFHGGFSTGHGVLREPNDIYSYSALACIAIQSNQNDQQGGQAIVNFDYSMAMGVRKTRPRFPASRQKSPECDAGSPAPG